MNNKQIVRDVKSWQKLRQEWIDILVKNPRRSDAAQMIISINSKIEVYQSFWSWAEEENDGLEFPL